MKCSVPGREPHPDTSFRSEVPPPLLMGLELHRFQP